MELLVFLQIPTFPGYRKRYPTDRVTFNGILAAPLITTNAFREFKESREFKERSIR